ncbi:hypothetical protein R1sor_025333 [Riccia sorocarpa]|uniref:Uncharacterized protein n=1 Tax=Riccia sorocarpa TaxID=122646 RepID=A0ABD3GBK4_9MARC
MAMVVEKVMAGKSSNETEDMDLENLTSGLPDLQRWLQRNKWFFEGKRTTFLAWRILADVKTCVKSCGRLFKGKMLQEFVEDQENFFKCASEGIVDMNSKDREVTIILQEAREDSNEDPIRRIGDAEVGNWRTVEPLFTLTLQIVTRRQAQAKV